MGGWVSLPRQLWWWVLCRLAGHVWRPTPRGHGVLCARCLLWSPGRVR